MEKYPRDVPVDMKKYDPAANDPEAYYGLPQNVAFCQSCVISNQRPNSAVEFAHTKNTRKATIHFDDQGACDACPVAQEKHEKVDWDERARQLKDLCDRCRRNDGHWDCLVPGSGGKDSTYASHILKH